MTKTLTVGQLVAELKKLPQGYKVFMSSDPEGNSFGSLDKDWMVAGSNEDLVITLMPIDTHMGEDIMPIQDKKIMAELRAEGAIK